MNRYEILGLRKAAIVLKAVADSIQSPIAKKETLVLVQCIIDAVNYIEMQQLATTMRDGEE